MAIHICILDDHPLIRDGLRNVLKETPDFILTGEFDKGNQLITALKTSQPDVILLDLQLPDISGDEIMKTVKKDYPQVKVIILTSNENPYAIKMLLKAGANGYLFKNSISACIVDAIQHVMQPESEPYLQDKVKEIIHKTFPKETGFLNTLTPRELEILNLISQELTSQEIGEKLFIHFRTVEIYRVGIMRKLGAKNMIGMVKKAIMLGLIKS